MNFNVVPYDPWHLEVIKPKKIHAGEMPLTVSNYAVTCILDLKPIAILGGFEVVPGVLYIWAIMSEDIRRCPITFHKEVLKILKFYEVEDNIRRIQVEVRKSYIEGQRWVESLGFIKEGLMKAYSPDSEDCYLYARVK